MVSEKQILDYLISHPEFLQKYADQLGYQSPKQKKVLSFNEVQLKASEKKIDNIAKHMETVYKNALLNQQLMDKLFQFNLDLLQCKTVRQVLAVLELHFKKTFNLPIFVLRFISSAQNKKSSIPAQLVLAENSSGLNKIKKLKQAISGTQCIDKSVYEWLPQNMILESFLQLPIRYKKTLIAVLVIAHADADYFVADARTDYVELLAQSIAATLARIMGISA